MSPLIFCGPSLNERSKELIQEHGLEMRPPVSRGDIDALNEEGFTGTLIIVDGRFKEVLAVGHAEIRQAMDRGCTLWGLSSMGAIRAYEMESLGMKGYGRVFKYFVDWDDFQDDEVALLHGEHPYYFSFSEPLVHFRECIAALVDQQQISQSAGEAVISALKQRYFGERTMELFVKLLAEHSSADLQSIPDKFESYRIKQADLVAFLEGEVWK